MTDYIQIVTTTQQQEQAQRVAQVLVSRRLAACGQVEGPLTSCYWWQGALETATEWRCTLKTRADLFAAAQAAIREVHPYQAPEIIATRIEEGHAPYLAWMEAELGPRRD